METFLYYWIWFSLVLEFLADGIIAVVSVFQLVSIYRGKFEAAGAVLFVFGWMLRAIVGIFAAAFLMNALYYETLPFWLIFIVAVLLFLAQFFTRRYWS